MSDGPDDTKPPVVLVSPAFLTPKRTADYDPFKELWTGLPPYPNPIVLTTLPQSGKSAMMEKMFGDAPWQLGEVRRSFDGEPTPSDLFATILDSCLTEGPFDAVQLHKVVMWKLFPREDFVQPKNPEVPDWKGPIPKRDRKDNGKRKFKGGKVRG